MRTFFDDGASEQFKTRLANLRAESERHWGKMNAAQMVAHLCKGMEQAMGDVRPPRVLIGRIIGGFIKSRALGNDKPMMRNSPTVPSFVIADERDLQSERRRLCMLIDRAAAAGPNVFTDYPHSS